MLRQVAIFPSTRLYPPAMITLKLNAHWVNTDVCINAISDSTGLIQTYDKGLTVVRINSAADGRYYPSNKNRQVCLCWKCMQKTVSVKCLEWARLIVEWLIVECKLHVKTWFKARLMAIRACYCPVIVQSVCKCVWKRAYDGQVLKSLISWININKI